MAKSPIPQEIVSADAVPILTVEMHTTGEPTRIIYSGFPEPKGSTLLQKLADVEANHDHVRGRLMLEPRGHKEMYGALLVNETELTATGEADIGVIFMHTAGYSPMCGHATIAVSRFLVDFDPETCPGLFPKRNFRLDEETMTTALKLHCPCGVVNVTVPVVNGPYGRLQSDPKRPISFINVDSYATGIDVEIPLSEAYRWPELGARTSLTADISYGGAFYCLVDVEQLGFKDGLKSTDLDALSRATAKLRDALKADPRYKVYFQHPTEPELSYLYGVIVRDPKRGVPAEGAEGAEVGLCFFGAQQVDRSPCGSGSAARRALAHAKHGWPPEKKWTYHCFLSDACGGLGGFTASVVGKSADQPNEPPRAGERVRIRVEGQAFYTGFATFLAEAADGISASGFVA
ncbi:uncharacterized protein P884DRAFT_258498 [Thermothelomyces heterothallicus CBS 202.75]|uniref:uncharacterized protein n=1 Tax=Thermothelomyces heterothallicus CBS 202.75 TaxID=1149848 RepID=UPI003743B727